MNKYYKIAICGKAGSGKDTVGRILKKNFKVGWRNGRSLAFANYVKEAARKIFPAIPRKYFYGPSSYRSYEIPGAFKNGKPLTVRQLLIDVGTGLGRSYNENIWIDAMEHDLDYLEKYATTIITDVRFRNEFDMLKRRGYFMIRICRDNLNTIDDISETGQNLFRNDEFDYVLHNNLSKKHLKNEIINNLVPFIKQ